jgi:hypothetical protein
MTKLGKQGYRVYKLIDTVTEDTEEPRFTAIMEREIIEHPSASPQSEQSTPAPAAQEVTEVTSIVERVE